MSARDRRLWFDTRRAKRTGDERRAATDAAMAGCGRGEGERPRSRRSPPAATTLRGYRGASEGTKASLEYDSDLGKTSDDVERREQAKTPPLSVRRVLLGVRCGVGGARLTKGEDKPLCGSQRLVRRKKRVGGIREEREGDKREKEAGMRLASRKAGGLIERCVKTYHSQARAPPQIRTCDLALEDD